MHLAPAVRYNVSLTIKFDTARYRNAMNQFVTQLNADGVILLQEEMRLLLRDVINLTPPTKSPKSDEVKANARQRGNSAVENDMRRLAAPLDWKNITHPGLAKAVYKRDIPAIMAITKNMGGGWANKTVLPNVSAIQSAHLANRDRWGRVRRRGLNNLAFLNNWTSYTRTIKKRVGWTRAGWHTPAQALGLKLPGWVSRHNSYAPGGYYAPSPNRLAIEASNRSIKIPNYYERHVLPALRNRARSLASELRRIVAGGGSRRASLAHTAAGGGSFDSGGGI